MVQKYKKNHAIKTFFNNFQAADLIVDNSNIRSNHRDAAKIQLISCKRVAKTPNHLHVPRLTASHKRFVYETDMTKQKVMPPEKMETPVSGYHLCH